MRKKIIRFGENNALIFLAQNGNNISIFYCQISFRFTAAVMSFARIVLF